MFGISGSDIKGATISIFGDGKCPTDAVMLMIMNDVFAVWMSHDI